MNSRTTYPIIVFLLVATILALGTYFQEVQSYDLLQAKVDSLQTQNISLRSGLNSTVTSLNAAENKFASVSQINNYLEVQLSRSQSAYESLLSDYSLKSYVYLYPSTSHSIPIWDVNQTMIPSGYEEWDLLDSFDNHLQINTNETAQFLIFDLESFVDFRSGTYSVPIENYTVAHFVYDIQLSVGCGVYVLFIRNLENSPNLILPNVTATYAPSRILTGSCAG